MSLKITFIINNQIAKALVSRLNKELSEMTTQMETQTKNLKQVIAEKEALAKTSSDLTLVVKERDVPRAAKEAAESEQDFLSLVNEPELKPSAPHTA